MTFTRAARLEALQRTGKTERDFPYLKTIHSICYHQLTIGRDQIVRPENLREFGKQLGIKLTGSTLDPWIEEFERGNDMPTRDDFLLQANHCSRHREISLVEALADLSITIDLKYATWFNNAYRVWKDSNGLLDYTDLLSQYVAYGRPLAIKTLFVDEAQDLSRLQWRVVERLGELADKWIIAGDDDQAIFQWAGADSNVFQDLKVDKTEVLHQSFRVSKAVYTLAMSVALRIKKRLFKEYAPTISEGIVSNAGFLKDVDLRFKTFILFRNHYRGTDLAQLLRTANIPFLGKGSPLTDVDSRMALFIWQSLLRRRVITAEQTKKLIRFVDPDELGPNLHDLIKEKETIKIDEIFMREKDISQWYSVLKHLPNRDAIGPYIRRFGFLQTASPAIELMSIHQSKGREAHTVILDPEMSKATWTSMLKTPDDEHRVWYVGITRAQERVLLLLPDGSYSYRF